MRIGIYNRHVTTMGGGERYMFKIAQVLRRYGDVEVLSQELVAPEVVFNRLGIDPSGLGFVRLPDASVETAERASENYDLFINGSHMDPVRSRAPASVLLVHFPSAAPVVPGGRLGQVMVASGLGPMLPIPVWIDGYGGTEQSSEGARFRWTNGDAELSVRTIGRRPVRLIVPLASFRHDESGPEVTFRAGGRTLATVQVPPGPRFTDFPVTVPPGRGGETRLVIHSDTFRPPSGLDDHRQLGVAVGLVRPAGTRGRVHEALRRRVGTRLVEDLQTQQPEQAPHYTGTYSAIWTVSRFVEEWTRRYWGVPSSIINPPVDVEGIQAPGRVPKENLIVTVGRFFAGSHNKKHLEMIGAFRRMVAQGLRGWTLVLVGGVSADARHVEYLETVRAAAAGLPVRIALDIPYAELLDLYARAAVYWHATGYGEDEKRDPAAMEHFGITTVEAMAAGCVPVVIRKAGQAEIVRHRRDGLLWRDLDDLARHTWSLIREPELRHRLSEGARRRSGDFSHAAFERRLLELVNAVTPEIATVPPGEPRR